MRASTRAAFVLWTATVLFPLAVRAQGPLASYEPVTEERLASPEPGSWLFYRRTRDGWGYSPLDQITTENVAGLEPVWTFSTGVTGGHEAPPIVNDGVMFVTAPRNLVYALDARTGDLLWRYTHDLPDDLIALHNTNRGVALYGDKVYMGTLDARVVALDARTGDVVWDTSVQDNSHGYYITLAPLAARGKVMVGVSGGELGIRGFVVALDAETGEELWRTYTVPGPGEPGNETWPGDAWRTGGGGVWVTGNYDARLGLSYWGTGNAGPWMGDARPGDNLYSNSVLALDVDTGAIRAYHQYHWNGSWDWDEVDAPLLIPARRNGRSFAALVHPARDGYLWLLERSADRISFVDAKPYVRQNAFTSIDPETGRPTYDEAHKPSTGRTTSFCPSLWGGKDWPPAAYNPGTGLLYIPANDNLCGAIEGVPVEYHAGRAFTGASSAAHGSARRRPHRRDPGVEHGHRREGVDPRLRDAQLGSAAHHGRQPDLQRRHSGPLLPRLRCADRPAALAVPHQLRNHRRAVDLHGRRRAVRRGTVRMGSRRRLDDEPHRQPAGHHDLRPAGRRGVGVRAAPVSHRGRAAATRRGSPGARWAA